MSINKSYYLEKIPFNIFRFSWRIDIKFIFSLFLWTGMDRCYKLDNISGSEWKKLECTYVNDKYFIEYKWWDKKKKEIIILIIIKFIIIKYKIY
jgi:hypothetical protein